MPVANYDAAFGGKKGAAAKARASMIKQYGLKKGTEVFYAVVNRNRQAARRGRGHR